MSERICGICQETCDHSQAIKADREMWLSAIEDTKYDKVLGLDDTTIDHLKANWASVIRSAPLEKELG